MFLILKAHLCRFADLPVSLSSNEKKNAEDFTLKHLLLFEICARETCEKFVYKHSKPIKYVKN